MWVIETSKTQTKNQLNSLCGCEILRPSLAALRSGSDDKFQSFYFVFISWFSCCFYDYNSFAPAVNWIGNEVKICKYLAFVEPSNLKYHSFMACLLGSFRALALVISFEVDSRTFRVQTKYFIWFSLDPVTHASFTQLLIDVYPNIVGKNSNDLRKLPKSTRNTFVYIIFSSLNSIECCLLKYCP